MKLPRLQPIIEKYGYETARQYFVERFRKPEAIVEYKCLFPDHLTSASAPLHDEILQKIPQGGKQAFAAPRGFAKSTVTNILGLSWLAIYGQYHFIILISDTYTQAKMHLGGLKSELETNEALRWLYGDLVGKQWGEDQIIVKGLRGNVMIMALGAGMKIRGLKYNQYRPELAVIDDLENSELVYSAERRDKLERWFNFDLIPGLAKEKNVVYLGTILHYHALLKKVIDRVGKYESWKTKLFKALNNGISAWKSRYSTEELVAMRDDPSSPNYVGSIVFAQEYQNDPQDDQDRIIKLEWIKSYNYQAKLNSIEGMNDVVRKDLFLKSLERYAGVDPAIGEKETSDNFSMYVMGFDRLTGEELQLDLIHGKFTIDEQVERIVNCCIEWRIEVLGIETVAYQAGLYQLVKKQLQIKGINTRIVAIKTDKDKIRRARIHSTAFEGGFVKLRTDHPKSDIIRREIEEFPFGEHDDSFDSLMLAREVRVKPKSRGFVKKPSGF